MATLRITFVTSAGILLPTARLKIILPSAPGVTTVLGGADFTAPLLGVSPVYTSSGVFEFEYPGTVGNLQPGQYLFFATAPGYNDVTVPTPALFDGSGNYTITFTQVGVISQTVSGPAFNYVSPMSPIPITNVGASSGVASWEILEITAVNMGGISSVIEVPFVGGTAQADIRARIILKPIFTAVPDANAGAVDPNFSDKYAVSFARLTPAGRSTVAGVINISVANAFPLSNSNTLTNYTNDNLAGLADWLTPWGELPKHFGHYADATIWLPVSVGGGARTLNITYQDINRAVVSSTTKALPAPLFASGKAIRVRIPDAPLPTIYYAILTISEGATVQTKPLIVRYING